MNSAKNNILLKLLSLCWLLSLVSAVYLNFFASPNSFKTASHKIHNTEICQSLSLFTKKSNQITKKDIGAFLTSTSSQQSKARQNASELLLIVSTKDQRPLKYVFSYSNKAASQLNNKSPPYFI